MINYTQIENDLKTWIKSVTGLANDKVISQNDNHHSPLGQYATVRIFDAEVIGHDTFNATSGLNDTVNLNYNGVRRIMVGINIYRDDTVTAQNQMGKLISSFNRLDTSFYFQDKGLGMISSSEVRDLPERINNNWEERKQADFFFYLNDVELVNVEAITKIAGNGFGVDYIVSEN